MTSSCVSERSRNEIRTERLSRVLLAAANRSSGVGDQDCYSTLISPPIGDCIKDSSTHFSGRNPTRTGANVTGTTRTSECNVSNNGDDDVVDEDYAEEDLDLVPFRFRRRTSSVPTLQSLDIGHHQGVKLRRSTGLRTVASTVFNGVVRRLHRPDDDDDQQWSSVQPCRRVRTLTTAEGRTLSALVAGHHRPVISSISSSGVSSRSHSPMPCSTLLLTQVPPGLPGSEPISPCTRTGTPASPYPENGSQTVLVIGSDGVGKTTLVEQMVKSKLCSWIDDFGENQPGDRTVCVAIDEQELCLRFVEINDEKNDLWLSLRSSAYIIMYNVDDVGSFRNASEVIQKVRERNCESEKPMILVSNKQIPRRSRSPVPSDEGKLLAKHANCQFFELCIGAEGCLDDLLTLMVRDVSLYKRLLSSPHSQNIDSTFHSRTWSDGSASSGRSLSPRLRARFWSKRKAKNCRTGQEEAQSCSNLTAAQARSYLFIRRGSKSLEDLTRYQQSRCSRK